MVKCDCMNLSKAWYFCSSVAAPTYTSCRRRGQGCRSTPSVQGVTFTAQSIRVTGSTERERRSHTGIPALNSSCATVVLVVKAPVSSNFGAEGGATLGESMRGQ